MSFHISLTSFEQIKAFVMLASKRPFEIYVGNDRQNINGKDFMGMASLDYSRPIKVHAECSADEFAAFRQDVQALQG